MTSPSHFPSGGEGPLTKDNGINEDCDERCKGQGGDQEASLECPTRPAPGHSFTGLGQGALFCRLGEGSWVLGWRAGAVGTRAGYGVKSGRLPSAAQQRRLRGATLSLTAVVHQEVLTLRAEERKSSKQGTGRRSEKLSREKEETDVLFLQWMFVQAESVVQHELPRRGRGTGAGRPSQPEASELPPGVLSLLG